jgi:hypothetical protein
MIFWKTSRGSGETTFHAKPHLQTSRGGREAMFQVKTHQTSGGSREVMFILSDHIAQDIPQAKPQKMESYK